MIFDYGDAIKPIIRGDEFWINTYNKETIDQSSEYRTKTKEPR